MATALFYGFDETTTVNLGHKITLYSQPKKLFVEEIVHWSQICLFDCFNERQMSVPVTRRCYFMALTRQNRGSGYDIVNVCSLVCYLGQTNE